MGCLVRGEKYGSVRLLSVTVEPYEVHAGDPSGCLVVGVGWQSDFNVETDLAKLDLEIAARCVSPSIAYCPTWS